MFFRIMAKRALPDLVEGLQSEFEVIGPVEKGDAYVFAPLESPAELRLDYDTTLLPPKKLFLEPEQTLMRFEVGEERVRTEVAVPARRRVLFGLHPCDINALLLLDNVMLDDHPDPYYRARRENTLIVGTSCTPRESCFCNALSTGEVHWGFDIFLSDLGDRYFVSVRSAEGAQLLDRHVESREITAEDTAAFQALTRRFQESFSEEVDTAQLPLLLDAKFDDPVWDDLGERCLSCGACSMVCPTCYCFDVQDRLDADQKHGERVRTWDSCQFKEFAEIAHGHNFRESRASRVKYRYYHKHWGYLSKFERVLCVGCGRCERACKAGISPREVIRDLQSAPRTEGGDR